MHTSTKFTLLFLYVSACRGVSTLQIQLKARQIAKELQLDNFQGGPSWCARFLKRKNLSLRQRTTMAQQLPADHQERVDDFRDFVLSSIEEYNVSTAHLVNMDEVPLTFDIPMSRTVEQRGKHTVTIRTTGHEKTHFTVLELA